MPTDRSVEFISKLVELTQDRKLEWATRSDLGTIEPAYEASLEGRTLLLVRRKANNSPFFSNPSSSRFILDILGPDGKSVFKFFDKTGLSDLYESAAYSAAKVDEFIDQVLGEKKNRQV